MKIIIGILITVLACFLAVIGMSFFFTWFGDYLDQMFEKDL